MSHKNTNNQANLIFALFFLIIVLISIILYSLGVRPPSRTKYDDIWDSIRKSDYR